MPTTDRLDLTPEDMGRAHLEAPKMSDRINHALYDRSDLRDEIDTLKAENAQRRETFEKLGTTHSAVRAALADQAWKIAQLEQALTSIFDETLADEKEWAHINTSQPAILQRIARIAIAALGALAQKGTK